MLFTILDLDLNIYLFLIVKEFTVKSNLSTNWTCYSRGVGAGTAMAVVTAVACLGPSFVLKLRK